METNNKKNIGQWLTVFGGLLIVLPIILIIPLWVIAWLFNFDAEMPLIVIPIGIKTVPIGFIILLVGLIIHVIFNNKKLPPNPPTQTNQN